MDGVSGATQSKIARPSGIARSTTIGIPVSRLIRPSFGITTTTSCPANQVTQIQRKTLIRRIVNSGNNNKCAQPNSLPKQIVNQAMESKESCLNDEGVCLLNGTKTLHTADSTASALTRSGTFVCDSTDGVQAKLLSVTHNINSPTPEVNQRERTFKRSLSPIYGETMNAAKRKSLQKISINRQKMSGPMLISTPRASLGNEIDLPYFTAQKSASNNDRNIETFSLDNTMALLDKDFRPSISNCILTSTAHTTNELEISQIGKNSSTVNENDITLISELDDEQIEAQEIELVENTHIGKHFFLFHYQTGIFLFDEILNKLIWFF